MLLLNVTSFSSSTGIRLPVVFTDLHIIVNVDSFHSIIISISIINIYNVIEQNIRENKIVALFKIIEISSSLAKRIVIRDVRIDQQLRHDWLNRPLYSDVFTRFVSAAFSCYICPGSTYAYKYNFIKFIVRKWNHQVSFQRYVI